MDWKCVDLVEPPAFRLILALWVLTSFNSHSRRDLLRYRRGLNLSADNIIFKHARASLVRQQPETSSIACARCYSGT